MIYQVLLSVVTGVGLLACTTFVTGYWLATGGRWARDEAGRFLMTFMGTLGALFLLVLTNQWVGEWPARRGVTVAVFAAFVLMTWWPLRLLLIAQRKRKG